MSVGLPESIDVWRAAGGRRIYEGQVGLASLKRLLPSLTDGESNCSFRLAFERDASGQALVQLTASTQLPLQCQRTLERFLLPVEVNQTLGLIRNEADEAALLPEVEPVLVPDNGMMRLLDLIEDELILAVPVLPVSPGTDPLDHVEEVDEAEEAGASRPNPFAVLASLKPSRQ